MRRVSEGTLFWFLELKGFETVSNGFYHVPCLPVRELLWLDDLLHAHPQFGHIWSSFAPFCICTAVPNRLPVLAFADSKRSHCKWIPSDSKRLLAWFGGMPSAPIFLCHPSTKTGASLDGKSYTAGIENTEPWPCPSSFASRSINCVRFQVKAHFSHHHHRIQVQLA